MKTETIQFAMRYLANIERFAVDECRLAHDIVSLQQLLPFLLHIVGRHFINIDEVHHDRTRHERCNNFLPSKWRS
jgi:hypothetical protein